MQPESFKFNFEKLIVWQKARELAKELYTATENFPSHERYGLTDQIRRAGISVASNIAEGTSRKSAKEQERFIEIAYGSLLEICCQLQLSVDLGFLRQEVFSEQRQRIREIALMLNALRNNLSQRK